MSSYPWYHKANLRVEQFLHDLDPALEVEVEETEITPSDGGDNYMTSVLVFSHGSNPNLNWTMEVQENDEFIENQLEQIVRKIYFERVE